MDRYQSGWSVRCGRRTFDKRRPLLCAAVASGLTAAALAQPAETVPAEADQTAAPAPPADPPQGEQGPWTIKLGLFAGAQGVAENEAFWGLADIFAPTADYSEDRVWGEFWAIPSVRLGYAASKTTELYGGLAVAGTGNLGRDVFEEGNSGRVSLENLYAGLRLANPDGNLKLDLSGGQQPYRMGTGMLIDLGAQNGNERGAALVAPRKSWEYTGILRLTAHRLSADAFVLNYNEISSDDPDTTLVGGKLEYTLADDSARGNDYVGIGFFAAVDSSMPYIEAPLAIIENGRDGTQTIDAYLRLRPLRERLPGFYLALEGAYQWNDDVDLSAYGLSAEVGHQWETAPLKPKLSYAFRRFSGYDPDTTDLERFDPMFYDGGVHAFASGSNAALAFYNTNVQTHRVSLKLTFLEADALTVSYWRVEAVETDSPLQFGQAGRLQEIDGALALVSGVPKRHLSDDFYVEYVRVINANTYLTVGAGLSFPGSGLEGQAGESLDPWIGGLINLTFQF